MMTIFLEDLVVDSDQKKPATYSTLKTGGFVTKAADRKGQLEKRLAKIDAKDDDDDDDDADDETEKEQIERETKELESELRKAERAEEKARDKEERAKATRFSKRIQSGVFLKTTKSSIPGGDEEEEKISQNGSDLKCGRKWTKKRKYLKDSICRRRARTA